MLRERLTCYFAARPGSLDDSRDLERARPLQLSLTLFSRFPSPSDESGTVLDTTRLVESRGGHRFRQQQLFDYEFPPPLSCTLQLLPYDSNKLSSRSPATLDHFS